MKNILFVCSTKIFYNNMKPIFSQIKKRGYRMKVIDFTPIWKVKEITEKLTPSRMNKGVERYENTGYMEVKNKIKWYHNSLSKITDLYFRLFKTDYLFVMSDFNIIEKSFVLSAKRRSIPVFQCIFTGFLAEDYVRKDFLADYFLVQSSIASKSIKRNNIDENRIFVVGRPLWNNINKNYERNPDLFKILIISEHFPLDMTRKHFEMFFKAMSETTIPAKQNIIVKLHPDEGWKHKRLFTKLAKENNVDVRVVKKHDLNNADVIVFCFSSAAVSCLVANKPIISVNPTGKEYPIPYVKYKAVFDAKDSADTGDLLQFIYFDYDKAKGMLREGQEKFLSEWYKDTDSTGDEIAKVLDGL